MSKEPSYPKEAAVGADRAEKEKNKREGDRKTRQIATGAAIGVGSAAIVAALLYANRSKKNEKK